MRRIPVTQRRAELVDAAIRVIARDGLAAATTRAIVAEAGMPLGAFHYSFASRDELVSAVIEQVTDSERLAAILHADHVDAQHPADIATVLTDGLEGYLALLESAPSGELALLEVALYAVRHDPDAVRTQWAVYRAASEEALAYAAGIAGVRWTRPVAELAHSLTRSLDGLTLTWLADRDSDAARAYIAFTATAFAALTTPAADPATPSPGGHDADRTR
ncbi:TetR family transcriptional regulator [Rathayibacter oskolensis]|uniref:TetR/AcrR family transcriptional regulator n=1 Tax=Rathayibacter oskolensis TaxID=1891671 RepID=UPI00265FB2D3|nr:TetR family transcriptional regulator [Rathayibacter oskolensis]WKK70380.1 TetR family transcriptional regulator [Rathayibacter oskolensis]